MATAIALTLTPVVPGAPTPVAEAAPSDIVALVVEGTGYGHGRGLSQWGAYGWAVDQGWNWQQILDHYYGGTSLADEPDSTMSVRLTALDGQGSIGLVSHGAGITWNGHTYASMRAVHVGWGLFDVYASNARTCAAGANVGDIKIGDTLAGPPAMFTTPGDGPSQAAANSIGVCQPNGSVIHYRGSIDVGSPDGIRVVNKLSTEQYLRGVVPREVPASWGSSGGGSGMNALGAQAVAARSYALTQNRYLYAKTCDTTSCQVYGGAGTRATAASGFELREDSRTDQAIGATAGKVRKWPNGTMVSTEFSASNGPRTAGGAFPAVDDAPGDGTRGNPNHRWMRILDADVVAAKYGLGALTSAQMAESTNPTYAGKYDGIWFDDVVLNGGYRRQAWDFRGDFGLPSPGFTVRAITRDTTQTTFAMIGDSVGNGIAGTPTGEFVTLTDGMFASTRFDMQDSRCTVNTACAGTSGVEAVAALPANLDLVVVELGYNDWSPSMASAIDSMMNALVSRGVKHVAWVNLATTTGAASAATYAQRNAALQAATSRWSNLAVLDWDSASNTAEKSRWFASDGVHLTATGDAQFALWLRQQVVSMRYRLAPPQRIEIPVVGQTITAPNGTVSTIPAGAQAVALNVTSVLPDASGFATVWPCGVARPVTSNLNFARGGIDSNGVIAPVGSNGKTCLYTHVGTDVVVDLMGWFGQLDGAGSGFTAVTPHRVADSRDGTGGVFGRLRPEAPVALQLTGLGVRMPDGTPTTIPANAVAAAINITAVDPTAAGYVTVWPCGVNRPVVSNVNFAPGAIRANGAVVALGAGGTLCMYAHVPTDVVVDVIGWFTAGSTLTSSAFVPAVPERWVDTREGMGAAPGPVSPSTPLQIPVVGRALTVGDQRVAVPPSATAVAMNVTVVTPSVGGFATVWPCGTARPTTSNVNYAAGSITANNVIAPIGSNGTVCVHVHTNANVVVDVTGWFNTGSAYAGVVPDRLVDSRYGLGPRPV